MKYFIIILITSVLSATPISKLTPMQKYYMKLTYKKAKQFDLELTMTAIAWVESDFGKYTINLDDPSCGIFHIMPSTLTDNKWKRSRICERLIKDYDFSFSVALERLKYFYNYWRSKGLSKREAWKRMIMSYNAGYRWKNGKKYYRKVLNRILILKKYFK